MFTEHISGWRVSEASEIHSGMYKFELVRYVYIYIYAYSPLSSRFKGIYIFDIDLQM